MYSKPEYLLYSVIRFDGVSRVCTALYVDAAVTDVADPTLVNKLCLTRPTVTYSSMHCVLCVRLLLGYDESFDFRIVMS